MPRLISVNVGLPKDVPFNDDTMRTAIWKQPVETRLMARFLNLEGDRQADLVGHGGEQRAVLVYQMESYRFWETLLQRTDFGPGRFGENFTVDGLDDENVCIGDRFRIGNAVFEISQPRVTCYKLANHMSRNDMPSLLVKYRRPGFYMRVIQEGDIGAGDEIEKVASGQGSMSVASVNTLLYGASHPVGDLDRAIKNPALSPGWRQSFEALRVAHAEGRAGNAGLTAFVPRPAWDGFRSLRVAAISRETRDVQSIELSSDDGTLPAPIAGQHIVLRITKAGPSAIIRAYSLSGDPASNRYRISVKREEGGSVSSFLHDHLQVGDRLDCSAPRGSFTLSAEALKPLVFLSAGVGVTPLLSMLHSVAARPLNERQVWWIHAARNSAHHAFAAEARSLVAQSARNNACIVYSRPLPVDRRGVEYDAEGHIDIDLLHDLRIPQDAEVYICGPQTFLEDLSAAVRAYGIDPSSIHVETFGSSPRGRSLQSPALYRSVSQGHTVTFVKSSMSIAWHPKWGSLLELAEANKIPVPWSCRAGVCHRCEAPVVAGAVSYFLEPVAPPEETSVLLCCAIPTSDLTLDV